MSEKTVLLASRIAGILEQLNSGQTVNVKDLAIRYAVSERTIQKDLNERLDPTLIDPLGSGQYRLVPGYLGNITPSDIKEFSEISGIIDLYPNIDDVVKHKIRDSLIVKSSINKGCIPGALEFKEINYTIINNLQLKFLYNCKDTVVKPYKLLNDKGIWYLLAVNSGIVKSYCLHKMSKVRRDIHEFVVDVNISNSIVNNPSPWFRDSKVKVVLKVKNDFVSYFQDRNIIPDKESEVLQDDKSLNVTLNLNSVDEIKGLIKFWLPNIDVIEPVDLKESIIKDIKSFL